MIDQASLSELQDKIAKADTTDFGDLIRLHPDGPKQLLRFANWSGLSFRGCDLREFDFTGARLVGCDFTDALIEGARFDQAEIDVALPNAMLDPNRTNLRKALDWEAYLNTWRRTANPPPDDHLPVGAVFQDAPFAPEMVVVPAGSFMMGMDEVEFNALVKALKFGVIQKFSVLRGFPQHSVTIDRPIAVGRFAVTLEEWEQFADPSLGGLTRALTFGQNRRPATEVSWEIAQAYLGSLTQRTGLTYRLLSESEWEYCCRAGTETAYNTGETISHGQANFESRYRSDVGHFPANSWGLYDMHGNIEEWCQDEWHNDYRNKPHSGSTPWQSRSRGGKRVIRGGACIETSAQLLSCRRSFHKAGEKSAFIGFRVARSLNK